MFRNAAPCFFAVALAWWGFTAAGHAAPIPPADAPRSLTSSPAKRAGGNGTAVTLADADISAVANQILGEIVRTPFSIDPGVTGKVTFRTSASQTPAQILQDFENALALNDVVLVRAAGRYMILPRAKARAVAPLVQIASAQATLQTGYQLVAIPVRYTTPSELAKSIETIGPNGIVIRSEDDKGLLVLGGASSELREALRSVQLLDRNQLTAGNLKVVQLRNAAPSVVAQDLRDVLAASSAAGVTIVPIERLKQLVITARTADMLNAAVDWATRFDTPSREEQFALWAYRPRNVPAEALAVSLNGLLGDANGSTPEVSLSPTSATSAPAAPPQIAPPARRSTGDAGLKISVNKDTNTLLVMAPESRWRSLVGILDSIDTPAPQVLIEATVLEVTLSNELRTGIDWSTIGLDGRLSVTSTQNSTGPLAPLYPGIGLTYMNNTVRAVVDALAAKTRVEVISAPKLVTLDNQTASLQVGDQVPVITQNAQGTASPGAPIVSNTEYKDTGIILKVKPRVNGPDSVVVDITQEVSSVSETTSSTINSPTISQRRFQVTTAIAEGQTVAIGGLISSGASKAETGAPWIKDVPGIGLFFRGNSAKSARTEIVVLLSARIIRDSAQATAALGELRSRVSEIVGDGFPKRP